MKKIKLESEDEGVSRMKNIELDLIDLSDFQVPSTAIREIALLRELQHPNIVNLKDILMQVFLRRTFSLLTIKVRSPSCI